MAEHSPSPTPERAIYGFVLYVASYVMFGFYVIWAYLPETLLSKIGLTYLPQRLWVFVGPLLSCLAVVFTMLLYFIWNMLNTPPLDSTKTITDNHANILPLGQHTAQKDGRCVPPLADIDIRTVTDCLYVTGCGKKEN